MALTFNGSTKTITLTAGTTSLSVRDLWSRWVDWLLTSDNSKYPIAMAQVGGNDIDTGAGTKIPIYAFLQNGWRLKPQEANHTLNVGDGVLLVDGGGDPFINTTGSFVVRVNYQQPVQAISFDSGGGGGSISPELLTMLEQFLTIEGYKSGVTAENSPTLRKAGAVELVITGYGTNFTTVQKV
jgi:hypothetical protein